VKRTMRSQYTRDSFGRTVMGPVFAEFALRLWMYVSSLQEPEDTALLFCARGGLRLQLLYERFLAASGLESPVRASALMVSRVVAVRPAVLAGADSAYEQLHYEFPDVRLLDVARVLTGDSTLDPENAAPWHEPHTSSGLRARLASDDARPAVDAIRLQVERFRLHLSGCAGGRQRLILCDSGLFGSTLQLLMDGLPEMTWSSVVVARANFKRLPTPHFTHMTGLAVEASQYCPWQPRTSILRYWHLIESILEPDLQSVRRFDEDCGQIRSNLEVPGWQSRILPEPGSIFGGMLDYIDALPPAPAIQILDDAERAWEKLRRAIVWPTPHESLLLDPGDRSVDFGRNETISVVGPWRGALTTLRKRSFWREGEIARWATSLRPFLLVALEAAYGARWCHRSISRLLR
jgi:hypothetical protein